LVRIWSALEQRYVASCTRCAEAAGAVIDLAAVLNALRATVPGGGLSDY
jgi:hypothetical protein